MATKAGGHRCGEVFAVPTQYWLFKSEPGAYSYDTLARDGVAEWDGVRNYQARNYMRDQVQVGDGVLFYHSSSADLGVVGTATVMRSGYPDHTAWDPRYEHPDPKSTPENPIWFMVDIQAADRFPQLVALEQMRQVPELGDMVLLRRGMRLSVQPVTEAEWTVVRRLGGLST